MYLRYYLHGISNISTPGYRRVVRGLRRVRLLRPPRVRTCQLRLQVGSYKDINCIFAENDPDDLLYREEKIVMSDAGTGTRTFQTI